MAKRPVPVPPEKADKNSITVAVPRRGTHDHVVNRHAPFFKDRRKAKSRKACRGRSSSKHGDFD